MTFGFYATVRKVVVNLKTEKAFQGVLWKRRGDYLVLRDAVLHENGHTRKVDGEVLIFTADVDFLQVLNG